MEPTAKKKRFSELRAAYNLAFSRLAREVSDLQKLKGQPMPAPEVIERAQNRVRRAEAEYRECRNAVSSILLGTAVKSRARYAGML